jgi:hypothetical protein
MSLAITEIHATPPGADQALSSEWFVVENRGTAPFAAKGCTVAVSRPGGRPREMGKLDPGFVLAPGGRLRLVTGSPASKLHGPPPAEEGGLTNYYLFLHHRLIGGAGWTVHLSLRQHELCRATYQGGATGHAPAPKEG